MTEKRDTLLIVDDMPANLEVLLTCLDALNFRVLVAVDGEDALEKAASAIPDLILLDILMPGMDGIEACRHLKANPKTSEIPVIFMSALTQTGEKIRGFAAGAVDYITKPIQHEEVLARISAHLTLRKQQKIIDRQNLQLTRQNTELQQQNKELDAFAHTVAHDLKNPLGILINTIELLKNHLDPSAAPITQKFMEHIETSSKKMQDIIRALFLLASARVEDVDITSLNMAEIVNQAQARLAAMAEEHQGEIKVPSAWPRACGYAPWIEEVWVNYLSNGLKYGGKPPRLELGASPQDNGYVRFWMRDNGKGLTPQQQEHLFVPFTRITQARVEGHGLGLSIVQRIVEKCGGEVGVDSEINKGSVFYFTLPAAELNG
ncbi:MAG: hybrid sensor histidine kinase/response regulator [Gammaproteobacteria bacterium]|nr:hybrid sensor histidine kinase/response regulator [Gammaproteobacteria bacterium]